MKNKTLLCMAATAVFLLFCTACFSQEMALPSIELNLRDAATPQQMALNVRFFILLTILSLAPSILIMLTSFTRIIIVLNFLRQGMQTQNMPPNTVLVGLALFLTFFIMSPVFTTTYEKSIQPLTEGTISIEAAYEEGVKPFRSFMAKFIRPNDLQLFITAGGYENISGWDDVPMHVMVPAFMISELTYAFQMGAILMIPFLVIDLIVASMLLSMGMMMVPPVMISMPLKIILFVLVDGWNLLTRGIILSFG